MQSSVRRSLVFVVGVLPLLADWLYKVILHPRPFWAFLYDPETFYIHDGMRLLSGRTPVNVDNPGTLVQLLTAAIEAFAGRSPPSVDAIRLSGYIVALLLSVIAAVLLERTLFREAPALLAIAGLWTFFMAPAALEYAAIWSPEILFFTVGALTLAALSTRRAPLVVGVCAGLCIGTKFVFLAWVPAVLLAIAIDRRRLRDVAQAALGIVAGFVAATLPVSPRYPDMARWLWSLASHSGWYGKGPAELPNVRLTIFGYWELALTCLPWIFWCALVLALQIAARRRDRMLMAFGVVAIATTILIGIRTPAGRYLLPAALGVVALMGAARGLRPSLATVVFVVASAVVVHAVIRDCRMHDRLIAEQTALRNGIDRSIARIRKPGEVVVFGWRRPEPSFALRVFAVDPTWLAETERLYPREGHFSGWNGAAHEWDGAVHLPAGAKRWDIMVLDRKLEAPVPVIRGAPDIGPFAIVRPRH